MEVFHGDIRITLSDEEAIRGLERTRASVKRQMARISREKAVIKIEGDIRELEKDLVQAERRLTKFKGMDAEVKLGIREGDFKKDIKEAQLQLDALKGQKIDLQVELKGQKAALAQAKALQAAHHRNQEAVEKYNAAVEDAIRADQRASDKRQMALQKEGQLRVRAERDMDRAFSNRERDERVMARMQSSALDMDHRRGLEIAKLRSEYDKANQALQRLNQTGRLSRAAHPERQMEFDIKSAGLLEQMAVTRAKLKAMNADPIDIPVDVKRSRALERLLGVGDIGMRLGPFTGTLKQFTMAALTLGPILTGLLGSLTALAGAVGAGLVGAVGIGGAALAGFGLTLGGVGALTASLFRDFKNLNTLQDAYHKQVLKTGAGSDKAKTKLKEFNHALGEVTPTTRAAFLSLDDLQSRWRGLRKEARPDFFNALGEAVTTANTDFAIFARGTSKAFHVVSKGFQDWMKGLRGGEAQGLMFTIMNNTTDAIGHLMPALGHLGAAFGRVTASFSRHFGPLMSDFEAWTAGIDNASQRTGHLNTGVDHLVDSFRDVLDVASAFGRVIIEISSAAMGSGGDLMNDMAGGLNDIAQTIHDNPKPLQDFFGDSIGTVKALYGVLQPLVQLFMEFSTILRPATNAVLSIISPVADLVRTLAGFGPIRAALQAWATMWLFRRGTAMAVGVLAGSVNALAVAMERAGRANAAAKLSQFGAGLRGGGAVRPGVGPGVVPFGVGAGQPLRVPAVAPAATTGFGRAFGGVTKGLGALTTSLLGVSPPVAALGLAAIGAAVGIKKMTDRANERAAQDAHAREVLGPNAVPKPIRATQIGPMGMAVAPTGRDREAWEQQRQAALDAAAAIDKVNAEIRESGQLQRGLVSIGSQVQNSRLMVEAAEKAYAAAVKNSGKKSLEARMALQQLRDARAQESQATTQWGEAQQKAIDAMGHAVVNAERALKAGRGGPFESILAKRLEDAKNSAAALDINLRRAKKGLDIFTGAGSEKIGALLRQFGNIPGLKRTLINVDTQGEAEKISKLVGQLGDLGQRKAIVHILADAENPKQALRLLNVALDKWEDRHPVAELRADKRQAEKELNSANKQLSMYGARKPEAALKARDEAQAKLDRLNKQLDHLNGKKATVTANVKFTLPSNFTTDATGGYNGSGDGQGVPHIAGAIKGWIQNNPRRMSDMFLKSAGGLGALPVSGTGLNAFNAVAARFGLSIGSGLRPGAITSSGNLSYHAMGRARDFPGPPSAMMAFARYMAATFGSRLKELIYTPMGFSIKNGRRVPPYAQADHYDHVHVAMARGDRVPNRTTKPNILYGEEAQHPEYFISTNPRYRRRSWKLLAMAANEIGGVREHSPEFDKTAMGDGPGFAIGGVKADKKQQRVIFQAIRIARSLGANRKATRALLMAIMHESRARNLRGGDASSSGILQVLASTARAMGINPRDKAAVIKAFLKRGFWGKGSAMALSHRKDLSAADIAHLVQGNATGTGVYAAEKGNAMAALSAFGRVGTGGSSGGAGTPPGMGAFTNIATKLAGAQGRLDIAGTTSRFGDDIRAIFGYDRKVSRRPLPANQHAGIGNANTGRSQPIRTQRPRTHHVAGLIDVIGQQQGASRNRLAKVNKALRGRLTPARRSELLAEKESLTTTIASNRVRVKELREQGAEARFQRSMRVAGIGSQGDIEARVARAASTGALDDDMAAASAQAKYYLAREAWAKKRGNQEKATEARNAYNQATEQIRSLTFQKSENFLSLAENQAQLTFSMSDDFKAASDALAYWKTRITEAHGRGDTAAEASAAANVAQYTERVATLNEDMKRLPLERDRALAALTDDIEDDKRATVALRDYWQGRLDSATKAGDLAGQIEAAGNLKSLNDEIKAGEESIASQMILLSSARRDLYKSFGSNFIPTFAAGTPQGMATNQNSGTVVNLTVNGADLGPDPHTWSQGVAWELQAAV